MRFIDSNIIAYAFYNNPYSEKSQKFLAEGGITNTLTLVEAFNIIQHEANSDLAAKAIRSLLKSSLQIIEVDVNLIFETLKKTQKYKKMKFLDLVHLTTALLYNCNEIVSYDKDFDGLDIKRIS